MNRLLSELNRLYLAQARDTADAQPALVDASGKVRAMVMELARPPAWEVLSRVWRGVQTELGLPAPAVAVSGVDGLQLWFSLAEPIEARRANAFLAGLRERFLADIEPGRVQLMPVSGASASHQERHARLVPAAQEQTGRWSAFLAPDLAPIFADSPWLDVPPNQEGQAALLRGLQAMTQAAFDAAFDRLEAARHPLPPAVSVTADGGGSSSDVGAGANVPTGTACPDGEARRFLLQVMQDGSAPLALRVEAAKALLQHSSERHPRESH